MHLSIETQLHKTLIRQGATLSLAESCTGGALAARLTQLPGCSQYLLGSIVAYSNDLKVKILGVDREILEREGAVSQAVVSQMLAGVLRLTGSDYGAAVSGIAGPTGGTLYKPVGTVWIAVGKGGENLLHSKLLKLSGSREQIIHASVDHVLKGLLEII